MLMTSKHRLDLWGIRFRKLVKMEEESREFYQRLLNENAAAFAHIQGTKLMDEIIRDEAQHARIGDALLDILNRKIEANPA